MRAERLIRILGPLLIAFGLSWHTSAARAAEVRLGVKGVLTLSGMVGVEPAGFELPPWHDEALGVGFGGGIYADLHFNRLLGLELDVLFEGNRLFFETYSGNEVLEQAVVYEQLRVPLMFKLIAHLSEHVEFTGALGPELLFGVGATPHSALYPPRDFNAYYGADEQFGFALSAAFGFGFTTDHLHIPIEFRFGYNMLGSYSYDDRVRRFGEQIVVVQAIENFQFGFMVGFGFRIPPYKKPKPPKPIVKPVEIDDPFYYPDPPDGSLPRVRRPW
jgi:hypothetical protein